MIPMPAPQVQPLAASEALLPPSGPGSSAALGSPMQDGAADPAGPAGERRLHPAVARQLPKILDLTEALQRRVAAWDGGSLEAALRTHASLVASIRFELLVTPGLRATPRERDEQAFRRHVLGISDCTQATWAAVRPFMQPGEAGVQGLQETTSAFTVEFRALQRRVAAEAESAEAVRAGLQARASQSTSMARRAAAHELMARSRSAREDLEALQALCAIGPAAQSAAYLLLDADAALRASLRRLVVRLGGGLLERLRALVAGQVGAPAEELRQAQEARGELQATLAQALADLARVQACGDDLLAWLGAITHRCHGLLPPTPREQAA